jgi:polysaccharide biosynthesis protein PslG
MTNLYGADARDRFRDTLLSLRGRRSQLIKLALCVMSLAGAGSYFAHSAVAATPALATLQAEQMTLPSGASISSDSQASGRKAVSFSANGTASGSVTTPTGTLATSMTVLAKATKCSSSWPNMSVTFDGASIATSVSVTQTGWTSYKYNLPAQYDASGSHNITVSAGNTAKGSCNRLLYVDDFVINGTAIPAPTVSLSASPASVVPGHSSTLTWTSTNAVACTASGAWSGVQLANGSAGTGPLTSNSAFSLQCSGPGGTSKTAAVSINVTPTANAAAGLVPGATFENEYVVMDAVSQQAVLTAMKADGVTWLRLDAESDHLFDHMMEDAQQAGINVDAVLQDWYIPQTPAAMATFATQEVQALKPYGIETYEVLNEPNGCAYQLSAANYTAILKATYKAVKAADPSATVISGGMCPNGGTNSPPTYLNAMYKAGAHGYFDAFNDHPYSAPDTPLQTGDAWNPWSYLAQLHSLMASKGDGSKAIWLTEFGCPTGTDGGFTAYCTDSSLAEQITDAFNQARTMPWIGPLMIYNWIDTSSDDFGLYYSDATPKTAALAAFVQAAGS